MYLENDLGKIDVSGRWCSLERRDTMKKQSLKHALTVIWLLAAGVCYSCSHVPSQSTESEWKLEISDYPEDTQEDTKMNHIEETEPVFCYVYLCGEVNNPGVYELMRGDRVFQAVKKAGGVTEDAAQEYLNLAAEVTDGMRIRVPSKEEAERLKNDAENGWMEDEQSAQQGVKVNLNTATLEQLMTLRGIGESRARDIIAYREEHGGFKKIEDIKKVSGIKDAAFQKIKEDITV